MCGDTPPTSLPSLGSSDFRDPGEAWSLGSCGCGLPGPGRGRGTLWAKRFQSGFPRKLPRPEPLPPTSSAGIQATPFLDGLAGIRHARNGASCPPGPEALWFSLEPPSSCCRPQRRDRMVRQRTAVPPTPTGASTMLPSVPPTMGGQHLSFPPCSPAYCHPDMGLIPWPALEETVCLLWGLPSSRTFLLSQGGLQSSQSPWSVAEVSPQRPHDSAEPQNPFPSPRRPLPAPGREIENTLLSAKTHGGPLPTSHRGPWRPQGQELKQALPAVPLAALITSVSTQHGGVSNSFPRAPGRQPAS